MSNAIQLLTKRLLGVFFSRKQAVPSTRFRVVNISSNTELASNVEVADTGSKRSKGLLGRDSLSSGEGLWIVPCESVHTFGMRFAIDLVYLDRQQCIRKVRSDVPPWRISACFSAHSVIELASGALQGRSLQKGDKIEFYPIETDTTFV